MEQKGRWVPSVAECKHLGRCKKCGYQGRGESILITELGELLIHRSDKASLFDGVYVSPN